MLFFIVLLFVCAVVRLSGASARRTFHKGTASTIVGEEEYLALEPAQAPDSISYL
jgi:hypothetical protein